MPSVVAVSTRTPRRWRRRLALLLGSIACTLLLAEIVLRLLWTPPAMRSTQAFAPHPVYGLAPIARRSGRHVTAEYEHDFRHSAQGWRMDHEVTRELPAGKMARVLFLGDSFTYGLGVAAEESFVGRVAAALPAIEVINAGCNGTGQREQLAVLDRLGAAVHPDLTIVCFFWNDLADNSQRRVPAFERRGDGVVRTDPVPDGFDPLGPGVEAPAAGRSDWTPYLQTLVKHGLKAVRYRWFGISDRFVSTPAQREAAWQVTDGLFGLMQARAAEIGTQLLVVCLPDHNQVDPEATIANIDDFHFGVQEPLRQVCERHGLRFVDLLPALRARFAADRTPLYWYADRHLTAAGNAAVAEVLTPILADEIDHAGPTRR